MRSTNVLAALSLLPLGAWAADDAAWQACTREQQPTARLACFDAWARAQAAPAIAAPPAPAAAPATAATTPPPPSPDLPALEVAEAALARPSARCGSDPSASPLARYWELEKASGCGVFRIRIYRPMQLSVVHSNSINTQPTSENPLNSVATAEPYRKTETRIQLSVRTKVAEGLLTGEGPLRDSLWFGYTQQSSWQLFTPDLSRPFRNTDHEPEIVYIHPVTLRAPGNWTVRYGGLGLVHQSNGQSLPRSRSWNRAYVMAGADHPDGWTLQARAWRRLPEDAADDDNPGISSYVGRAELLAGVTTAGGQTVSVTWRTPLRDWTRRGSVRLEWMLPLAAGDEIGQFGRLRLHTQLFNGFGDSLLDYNRRRTVFSVGLSLVDW